MAITISLSGLNGDWQVNNQSGINRIWTRGIYSIVYSKNMFGTSNAGWIVKITDGVEIFGIKTDSGEVWDDDAEIIWNPNATGYDDDTTANLVISVIEEANPIDINPAYYKCDSVMETTWTGYKMKWDKDNGWINQESLTNNLTISGFTPEKDKVYNVNTTSLIYLYPDIPDAADYQIDGNVVTITPGIFEESQLFEVGTGYTGELNIIPGTSDKTIPADTYISSTVTIKGDSNLRGDYIKEGVTLFGVPGTYEGSSFDFSEATDFTGEYLRIGQYGYNRKGALVEGSMNELTATEIGIEGSTSIQLEAGYYADVTVAVWDDNLTGANIKQGVTILGIPGEYTGSFDVAYGYIDDNGDFQQLDLSEDTPASTGTAESMTSLDMFKTGVNEPSYSSSGGNSIEFYECASYTPNAEAYTKYFFTLSGASDEKMNGTYVRTFWVEVVDESNENFGHCSTWVNENGYEFREGYYSAVYDYSIYNDNGSNVELMDSPEFSRLFDYSHISWQNGNYSISPWQTEAMPATTESWSGYKMVWNTDRWQRESDTPTEGLMVTYLTPRVGEIYSVDTSIKVERMYDGGVIPITQDGLVFYAPLAYDSVDVISKTQGVESNITYSEHLGKNCVYVNDAYCSWKTSDIDVPNATSPFSIVVMFSPPVRTSDWEFIIGASKEENRNTGVSIQMLSNDICTNVNGSDLTTSGEVVESKWHTSVLTGISGIIKLYLDGSIVQTFSQEFNNTLDLIYVGADLGQASPNQHTIQAYIAHAAVYNRELSSNEILEIHNTLMEDVEQ